MKRIIYGAPVSNTPAGGVKVIYRHCEKLKSMGIPTAIWHPGDANFRCTWFNNLVDVVDTKDLSPDSDFIVIPEIWASTHVSRLKGMGFQVGIFVQNCYYTHVNLDAADMNAIENAYANADCILSISEDGSRYLNKILHVPANKIVIQRYSIDTNIFNVGMKSKLITYMPRKMGQHSARVVSALKGLLPSDWEIRALDSMTESQVALNMKESIIFLAFSEFEGLPVPPVEAALAGNIVIGYHGQGGVEYWNSPNFIEVDQGNIIDFVDKVLRHVRKIEAGNLDLSELNRGISNLTDYFSPGIEEGFLSDFYKKII